MRHNRLDLNLLVALDALLQECSVSRAADRVFITQPAMSNSLARLRRHLQDELVVQVGRKMVLTERAVGMKDELRSLLLRISSVTRPAAPFEPGVAKRQFRIAASDYFCSVALPELLRYLALHAPGIAVDVLPLSPRLNEDLERGEVDLLIVPSVYALKGFASVQLFRDDWVCVSWQHSKKIGPRLTMKRFLEAKHVIKRENHPLFPPLDGRELSRLRQNRTVSVQLPQYGLLPMAVVGTDWIATVQRGLAELAARTLPIKLHECPFSCPKLVETMQWHSARELDPGHTWLRAAVQQSCSGIVGPARG